jgi:signal transduction histidine kinase
LSSSVSIGRGYRTGFFFVVALLAAVAGFTLWGELRTNARIDDLVSQALERDGLIGRIRMDALTLGAAVEDHINAGTDEDRQSADTQMEESLASIKEARESYTRDLPVGEREVWNRFDETARALAQQVRTAVKYSNRKEAERARKHLEEEVRPVNDKLEELAGELVHKNAEVTRKLLSQREDLRSRTTLVTVVVSVTALIVSLLVGRRVTSVLRRQERTIHDQMAELDRRNRELDAFASRVAHDLVAPLSPLKGYLTLTRRSPSITDPSVREMLEQAEASAGRMAELIEALLRFCRASNPTERVISELDTAVTTILLELDQVAALQKVQLERELAPGVKVECPQQLLQSIAQNLLSNAVKYTAGRPNARVRVRVAAGGDRAVLEVDDNGPGMNQETLTSLFRPFFRAPGTRMLPGHGLGLATTKRLVEAHGGSIDVKSEPNVGTRFTVTFPLVRASANPAAGGGSPGITKRAS